MKDEKGPTHDTGPRDVAALAEVIARLIDERDDWRRRFEAIDALITADTASPAARYWQEMHLARVQERDDALDLAEGRFAEAVRIQAEMQARIEALSKQVTRLQRNIRRKPQKRLLMRNRKRYRKGEKRGE